MVNFYRKKAVKIANYLKKKRKEIMMAGLGPPVPPRTAASQKRRATWRESLAALLCVILLLTVLASSLCLFVHLWREKNLYDELVVYLQKTEAISKINYNNPLRQFRLEEEDLDALGRHRTYKTILWTFFFADLGCLVMFVLTLLLYFTVDVSKGKAFTAFWILFGISFLYCIAEVHVFSFALFPYSTSLSKNAKKLLSEALPHNPQGVDPIEHQLGCTFDVLLLFKYTLLISVTNSFVSKPLLWTLLAIRLMPIVLFIILVARKCFLSTVLASFVEKFNGSESRAAYVFQGNIATPLPPLPSPGAVDHSISYNNAAYFAGSGNSQPGLNSSRSSEISRCDAIDLYKPVVHTSSSVMSEV
uniref:Transmembrane protein n=1 Tax=Syphacia muris TaxID=451379 RepID=A0A158R412_9BILA